MFFLRESVGRAVEWHGRDGLGIGADHALGERAPDSFRFTLTEQAHFPLRFRTRRAHSHALAVELPRMWRSGRMFAGIGPPAYVHETAS